MVANYQEAIEWIHSRLKFGVKPGLKRMEWLLEKFNHPEKKLKIIHVAGTNGKGSTISYLRHMLQEAGYKVGTFTSPYIETFNERISVNGEPISDQAMLNLVNEVKPFVKKIEETDLGGPTEFEIITTMMFLYFGTYNTPDFLLLETGLGGRLDSTNVIEDPLCTIITNVGFDHMNILGNTIEEIAAEKAGIIKDGVPIFTASENETASHVISEAAYKKNATFYSLGEQWGITNHDVLQNGEHFSIQFEQKKYEDLFISMMGQHQTKNAALAVGVMNYLNNHKIVTINEQQMRKGLEKTSWKGRFELVNSNPEVIIDGAHNIEGIESLVTTLQSHYKDRNIHFLVSVLKDKEYGEMINRLSNIAASMHFTTFDFPRAAESSELYAVCRLEQKRYSDNWEEMMEELLEKYENGEEDLIVVVGSLYFISLVRSKFSEDN